jgi:tetratricopeptide (TPR) repeat protein
MRFQPKRILLVLAILALVTSVPAALIWRRSNSLPSQVAKARLLVGTPEGGALLNSLAAQHPDNAEVMFLQARQLRLQGRGNPASAALKRCAVLGWSATDVQREQLLLLSQANFRAAEPRLRAWLDSHAGDREALLALASGYAEAKQFERAESLVNAALALGPDDGAAHLVRGTIYLQKRQLQLALPDLEMALERGAKHHFEHDAKLQLGVCLLDLGRFDEALALFRQCRSEDPENPRPLYGIGRCARYLGRSDEAAEAFERVLQLRPDHVETLLQLAYVHEERGDWEKALKALELAEKKQPHWFEVPFRMAKILTILGQNDRAARYQARYLEMQKRWLKRRAGQSPEEVFQSPEESAFPKNSSKN